MAAMRDGTRERHNLPTDASYWVRQALAEQRSLTPVPMTVVVGQVATEAEVPVVVEGKETVRP